MTTEGSEPAAPEEELSRAERSKALTRQQLIDAARVMLAAGTAAYPSIQEIIDTADVVSGARTRPWGLISGFRPRVRSG